MASELPATAKSSPAVSPRTIPASLSPARGRPFATIPLPSQENSSGHRGTTSPKPLEVILCSPKFPEGYNGPVWRVIDALERIKGHLKKGDADGTSGMRMTGVTGAELKAVWMQLEIIGNVVCL